MNFVTKHRFCTLSGPGQVMTQFRVALFYWMTWPWPDDVIRPQWPSTIIVSERALNVAEIFFLCARRQAYSSGERLWINSDGKMETRHPVEGPFGSEFLMIFNDCGVMTAWSRKTWKFCEQFLRFLKTTPYGRNSVPKVWETPIDIVVFKCREIRPTGNRWNRALFTGQKKNKISAPFETVATARIAPKVCQGQPPTFDSNIPNFIQIGSRSVEL